MGTIQAYKKYILGAAMLIAMNYRFIRCLKILTARKIAILTSFLIMITLIYIVPLKEYRKIKILISNDISCYRYEDRATLPNILDDNPPKDKSIFFHETSCISKEQNKISITLRQGCAVEAAARLNPNFTVYLIYTSPGTIKVEDTKNYYIFKQLMTYENIRIKHLNFKSYLKGSPVEELYRNLQIEASLYPIYHSSDVLRFLTLWKYGGIYVDLDVMMIKSVEKLKLNFAGLESNLTAGSSILSFSRDGIGNVWATQILEYLQENFDTWAWNNNGPGTVTR